MKVRRVATGHDENGKAVVASDVELEAAPLSHLILWGADETIRYPNGGAAPGPLSNFPRAGGFRFSIIHIPAGYDPENNPPPAPAPQQAAPASVTHHDPDDPGMHWTETIDCEIVLSGALILELDDGREVVLHPGDAVVQNGTRHRWKNLTDEPASFVAFIVGAHHDGIGIPVAQQRGTAKATP